MSASDEFVNYILDLLAPLSQSESTIYSQSFFGGKALRQDGIQFAMIMSDRLYLCVDDYTRPDYEALEMEPFSYQAKKGHVDVKKYFSVPVDWLEDPDTLIHRTRIAIQSARKARHVKT